MTNSILIFGGESDIALAVKAAEPSTILIPYEDCDVRVSSEISEHLKSKLHSFTDKDSIIFNNKVIEINNNFKPILKESKPLTFIDGGQAELISAANFNVSFKISWRVWRRCLCRRGPTFR